MTENQAVEKIFLKKCGNRFLFYSFYFCFLFLRFLQLNCRQQAQNGQNKEVMRFFSVDDFNPFSVGRWVDRIRIVCRQVQQNLPPQNVAQCLNGIHFQPYRRDVAFGLSTMVVRGNNLDDDDDSDDLDPTAAAAKQVCTLLVALLEPNKCKMIYSLGLVWIICKKEPEIKYPQSQIESRFPLQILKKFLQPSFNFNFT